MNNDFLEQRVRELSEELERQFEDCRRLSQDKRDLQLRLEQVEKQAAAMALSLEALRSGDFPGTPINLGSSAMSLIEQALCPDAGQDFVHKDDVKRLAEALEKAREELFTQRPRKTWCQTLAAINSALEHAKEKGLM